MTDAVVQLEGRAGEPVALPIAQGPATGYSGWLSLPEGVVQVDEGAARSAPPGQHLGAALGGPLQVRAGPGRYRLTARLARRWSPDDPIQTLEIDLLVR